MFKFDMIVDDSFCRLNERMIVHDSFLASGFCQKQAQILFKSKMAIVRGRFYSHSDYSDAESEKVKKPKKSRKLAHEKWSGSLICKLIDEYEVRPCLWDIFYHVIVSADLSAAIFVYNFKR